MEEAVELGQRGHAPVDEGPLVEAAIAGDAQAFAQLYDLYVTRVYRHIYYRVGRKEDAEDLTQQVFLQAWRAIRSYRRTEVPFVAWLLTIASNAVISFYRKNRPTQPLEQDVRSSSAGGLWADPEGEALARFDREEVRRAILKLRPEQQQVVLMRFIEQMEYPEIAAALGKSEGNVRVILHRALLQLRQLVAR